jgi:hypothetical protein
LYLNRIDFILMANADPDLAWFNADPNSGKSMASHIKSPGFFVLFLNLTLLFLTKFMETR